jgi:type IV pilus assembly protein PilM
VFTRRAAVTGIDLGRRSVKLVRIENGVRPRLAQWGIEELPIEGDGSPAEQSAALLRLLDRLHLKPRSLGRVAAVIGGRDLHLRQASLPRIAESDLRRALPYEARKHLPLENVASACLDFQVLDGLASPRADEEKPTREALLVACPLDRRNEVLGILDASGIEPDVLDAKPLPALNAVLEAHPPAAGASWTVVLDLGASSSALAAVLPEGNFYHRLLEFTSDSVTASIEKEFHLDYPSAERVKVALQREVTTQAEPWMEAPLKGLFRELEETFRFLGLRHRTRSVGRLYLVGGGGLLHGIRERLANVLQVEVSRPDPFRAWKEDRRPAPEDALRLVEALGLATWWD